MKKIPIIDLFAGPGGLGEGFSSLVDERGRSVFDIKLSIEKDVNAHKTLTLRSFFRQFKKKGEAVPKEYYDVIKENSLKKREALISIMLDSFPEGLEAKNEACLVELGSKEWSAERVDTLIEERLEGQNKKWLLIGGPPCQAYSNVGRSRVGGIDPEDHRVYLYKEYLRIITKHRPAVYVMENVKGLLSANVGEERVFDRMKVDLSLNGDYTIYSFVKPVSDDRDFLIKSERYGIPQKRHRVILLGVRNDLEYNPQYLKESNEVSLKSIIENLPKLRSGLNRTFVHYNESEQNKNGKPKRIYHDLKDTPETWTNFMKASLAEIKDWGEIDLNSLNKEPQTFENGIGSEFVATNSKMNIKHPLSKWYNDNKLEGVANHQSRSHLTQDLMRYLFAGLYVEQYGTFPRLEDFARHNYTLIPDHENVESGKFTDRFRVQVAERPATTVTSHISKDGHYFIHYDPKQCRSLTVREAARIQTFPDNYLFRGSRTQQFHQVGNAVPPYLAHQLALIVSLIFKNNEV